MKQDNNGMENGKLGVGIIRPSLPGREVAFYVKAIKVVHEIICREIKLLLLHFLSRLLLLLFIIAPLQFAAQRKHSNAFAFAFCS